MTQHVVDSPMPTARFVILHHRAPQGEHWDLMIQRGEVLATWQLLADPRLEESWPIPVRRIQDHRLDYLTYEGPLSGGRGEVARIDEGECSWPDDSRPCEELQIAGRILDGGFRMAQVAGDGGSGDQVLTRVFPGPGFRHT
jgi:hypothetical protein